MLLKTHAWQHWNTLALNERQVKLINRLLDGFEGKLTSSKWAAIAKCSPDTALRDITELLTRGVLQKSDAGGRSTSYELVLVSLDSVPMTLIKSSNVIFEKPQTALFNKLRKYS